MNFGADESLILFFSWQWKSSVWFAIWNEV